MRFQGVVYRAHDPRWAFSPLSGEGASTTGGRFNRPGQPALYTALSIATMIKEAGQGFVRKLDQLTVVSYEVDCDDVADLTDIGDMQRFGVSSADLAGAWRPLSTGRRTVACWLAMERLVKQGCAAAIVPSFAPGATPEDRNLAFWRWASQLPHRITVHDPHGRLPKDHSSWK